MLVCRLGVHRFAWVYWQPPSWRETRIIFLKTNEARHSAENISFSEFVITLCPRLCIDSSFDSR
jgi:hypothetical protein